MTKKIEPTETYLNQLERDLDDAKSRFDMAKATLYRVTATAKLGEPEFENARKACLVANTDIVKTEAEIARVKKVLHDQ